MWRARLRLLFAVLAVLFVACGDSHQPSAVLSPTGYGVIEGRITGPDGPVDVVINAFTVTNENGAPPYQAAARTDSSGWYRCAVPYGNYYVKVWLPVSGSVGYGANGPRAAPGDPVLISPAVEHVRADFSFGGYRLRIPVPPGLMDDDPPRVFLERRSGDGWLFSVYSDMHLVDGTFELEFPAIPEGAYLVLVGIGTSNVYLPYGSDEQSAERLSVRGERWTEAEYELPAPCTVHGTVRGCWPELGARTECWVRPGWYLCNRTGVIAYGSVDPNGDYTFQTFSQDTVRVGIWIGSRETWIGGPSLDTATRFALELGGNVELPELIDSAALFRLHCDELPVLRTVGYTVEVSDGQGGYLGHGRSACSSDLYDRIFIPNLQPGSYYVRLSDDDHKMPWIPTWFPAANSVSEAVPVMIDRPGQLAEFDWPLAKGGEIAWSFENRGRSTANAYNSRLYSASDSTEQEGNWVFMKFGDPQNFQGLRDGEYTLACGEFEGDGWRVWWYPGVAAYEAAARIVVRDHDRVDLGAWSAPQ